ncbi:NAD(P)-binding protein [Coniophora puteana RWD-64-598 SS2]|uniref:NAD(P)-binding protein n=1 Tax=Coniophora puteana (strain RWD-64-598) TaxID=741705 RepID=A0A5M3MD17_CONPW|nr:NAD(P)-binding protein [Coniophora puteana RWD-64-598 SS2]EIW76784.1 NAD(P)-binding protein [Coniophora puteana RWD-64-598 SS2]
MSSSIDRIALVTGAAQGIGKSIALRLAADDLHVALADLPRAQEPLESVAKEIEATTGRRTHIVTGDVSNEEHVERMVRETVERLGGLDVMIANAGVIRAGTVTETTLENWTTDMNVNATGTFLCFMHAGRQMIAQGRGGRMVAASSVAGKKGHPNQVAYCAAKFAVRAITQCAAIELGQHGITVNAYAPGAIVTPMREPDSTCALEENTPIENYNMADRAAVQKLGSADDVASIVSYLVKPEAHFITG